MANLPAKSQIHRNSLKTLLGITLFLLIGLLGSNLNLCGQEQTDLPRKVQRLYEEARQDYRSYEIESALEKVNQVLKKMPEFTEGWLLRAYCYKDLDRPTQFIASLKQVVSLDSKTYHDLNYLIAESWYNQGEYNLSQQYLSIFKQQVELIQDQDLKRKSIWLSNCLTFALTSMREAEMKADPVIFDQPAISKSCYFPSLTVDGNLLVYTVESLNMMTNQQQEDLFWGVYQDGRVTQVHQLELPYASGYNEGTQTLRQDGRLMIFTGCNYPDTRGGCDLYYAWKSDNSWRKPENMDYPVNTRYWESTPSLSPDSKMLIFSSNRPGGFGGMDLWYSTQDAQKSWSEPRNMGVQINSGGNELAPFFHTDGKSLYFSSDSLVGMGGLDIYLVEKVDSFSWSQPLNLGYPVNTHADEFGITIPGSADFAIFASDRDSSGLKKLFQCDLKEKFRPDPVRIIRGVVMDSLSGQPLQARITIRALTGETSQMVDSDPVNGRFLISLPSNQTYLITAERTGYLYFRTERYVDDKKGIDEPLNLPVKLRPIVPGQSLVLKHVYFDTDSDILKKSSTAELDLLSELLKSTPELGLDIEGYTDSVGSSEYNIHLSQRRAESIQQALIDRGIQSKRISAAGYGERKPIGDNGTEAGRALNRRTEIRLRKLH